MNKLIVFDWDGTLMDSEARIVTCMHLAIADAGLEPRSNDQVRHIIGLGLYEALVQLYPDGTEAEYGLLVERYRHHFLFTDNTPMPMFEGAERLIRRLHDEGFLLAVATGKGRQGLDKVLEETGLGRYFHYSRCADEAGSKPSPQMLLDIMDWLGVENNAALMIGDTEYDLQMASNAGVDSLAVTHGVHDKSRLLECNPLACVDNLAELDDWLIKNLSQAA